MNGLIAELRSIVGNEGGFLHKSFLGRAVGSAVKGFITGGPTGALAGGIRSFTGGPTTARPTVPRTRTARVTAGSIREREFGRQVKFPSGEPGGGLQLPGQEFIVQPTRVHPQDQGPCLPGLIRGPQGRCIAPTSPLGAKVLVGEATMGRYGAALIPGSRIVDRATCLRGMQLGNDGLCYNKGQITNKQRMWPAGRKPLLTGGQMSAISVAARAAKRLEVTTKRLQRMGMMKKPTSRRALPRGHVARLEHASEH